MRRLLLCLALAGLWAGCRHAYAVKRSSVPCKAEAGGGCLDKAGEPGTLVVRNFTRADVCSAHFRPSAAEDWSEPVDDATAIPAGLALDYHLKPTTWDLKLSDCAGKVVLERLRIPLNEGGAVLTLPGD